MKRSIGYLMGASFAVAALFACGGNSSTSDLTKWLGPQPHFVMKGVLHVQDSYLPDGGNGPIVEKDFNIDLEGADAEDTNKLYCKREYFANGPDDQHLDYSTAVPSEIKVIYNFVDADGNPQSGQIELKHHDFRSNQPGDQLTAILRPGNDAKPGANEFWLEWQNNHPKAKTANYGAQSGTYIHGEYQCTPDATYPKLCGEETSQAKPFHAPNGDVGGFVKGIWSPTDHATVSFTAHCIQDSVEVNPYQ